MTSRGEKARAELLEAAQPPRWIVWTGAVAAVVLSCFMVAILFSMAHFILKYW